MSTYALYDCHNHLYAEEFEKDRDEAIKASKEVGVSGMVTVMEFPSDFQDIIQLTKKYPNFIHYGFGLHPVQKTDGIERSVRKDDLGDVIQLIDKYSHEMVCVGEVGLDFTPRYCKLPDHKEHQKFVFVEQMRIAERLNLPLNVHSRSAGRPVVKLLKENNVDKALLHAFDGRVSVALEAVQAGYFFSIPPCVVRSEQASPFSTQKQKIFEAVPIDRILLETDCPALGPEKMVRNDPKNILLSLEFLAKCRKLDAGVVANIIKENTMKLFPKIFHE